MSQLRILQMQSWLQVFAAQAVIVVFFQRIGLSQNDFSLSQFVFSGTLFVANPVCGWIADRYSRPKNILLGHAITALAFTWYAFASSLFEVLLIEVLLGIGGALTVSANMSLMAAYATEENRPVGKAYTRLVIATSISNVALTAIGGWLGASNPRYALLFSAGLYLVAGGMMMLLKEVRPLAPVSQTGPLEKLWCAIKGVPEGIRTTLHYNRSLKWTILATCVGCQLGRGLLWVQSALYARAGVSPELIGLAWAIFLVPACIGSYALEFFVDRWKSTTLILVPGISSTGAMILMALAPTGWTIGLMAVVGLAGGWFSALAPTLIQREGDADELSFTKAVAQNVNIAFYILVTYAVGWAAAINVQIGVLTNVALLLPVLLFGAWKLSVFSRHQSA